MKARVKLLFVPTIQIQVGGESSENFIAEEQYLITKSGWTGYLNVVHEDAPQDAADLFTKPSHWLEEMLAVASKAGAPNTTVVEQIKLIQEFKNLASQNISDKYEMSLDEDDVNETADRDRPVMKEDCKGCGPACVCEPYHGGRGLNRGEGEEG